MPEKTIGIQATVSHDWIWKGTSPGGSSFTSANQPVREAVSYRGLFTAGWFGVRENTVPGWKFTIVYEQANRLNCPHFRTWDLMMGKLQKLLEINFFFLFDWYITIRTHSTVVERWSTPRIICGWLHCMHIYVMVSSASGGPIILSKNMSHKKVTCNSINPI